IEQAVALFHQIRPAIESALEFAGSEHNQRQLRLGARGLESGRLQALARIAGGSQHRIG
ncbi:hypothetical protein LCGC14_2352680, partial [marine sediment metagenome]